MIELYIAALFISSAAVGTALFACMTALTVNDRAKRLEHRVYDLEYPYGKQIKIPTVDNMKAADYALGALRDLRTMPEKAPEKPVSRFSGPERPMTPLWWIDGKERVLTRDGDAFESLPTELQHQSWSSVETNTGPREVMNVLTLHKDWECRVVAMVPLTMEFRRKLPAGLPLAQCREYRSPDSFDRCYRLEGHDGEHQYSSAPNLPGPAVFGADSFRPMNEY